MPYIINVDDIDGLHDELMQAVYNLQTIWDDKQYQYFCEKYVEPLACNLRNFEDAVEQCSFRIYDLQMELENL